MHDGEAMLLNLTGVQSGGNMISQTDIRVGLAGDSGIGLPRSAYAVVEFASERYNFGSTKLARSSGAMSCVEACTWYRHLVLLACES